MDYTYHIYGSDDSTDIDAVFFLDELPIKIEDRKNLTNSIKSQFGKDWNPIIAKIENGIIVDCTYPKSSPESLNNAVFKTYHLHKQEHPLLITSTVKRNVILAIYKTVRIISTYLTRTEYRPLIRPTMNWRFDFTLKLEKLKQIDFTTIKSFNQPNVSDIDIWKTYAFYLFQNLMLIEEDIEVYTKKDVVLLYPETYNFLYRQENLDIKWFQKWLRYYIIILMDLDIKTENNIISLNNERANMELEIPIK